MIEYIKGSVAEISPACVVLEAAGVGYEIFVSLNTYTAVQQKKEAKLFIYESIREDAHILYGFATKSERQLFVLLTGVSGIGAQTARTVLSAFTTAELATIIREENVAMLKSVKGIGPKAASRIVLDLKDKISLDLGMEGSAAGAANALSTEALAVAKEAVAALTTLGYSPAPTQKVVSQILKDNPAASVELVIKQALKML